MSDVAINLWEKLAKFADYGSPRVIAEIGDCQVKLIKFRGREVWRLPEDRIVIVLDGELALALRDETVSLSPGEMYLVRRDTEHHPMTTDECFAMLVEPKAGYARPAAPVEAWA